MSNANYLTLGELESLKRFAITWIAFYSFAPPESMLRLFIFWQRIIAHVERAQQSISTISITEAPTIDRFHSQMIANIQNSRSMMK